MSLSNSNSKSKSSVNFMLGCGDEEDEDEDEYNYMNKPGYVSAYETFLKDISIYDKIPIKQEESTVIPILPLQSLEIITNSSKDLQKKCITLFDEFLNLFEYLTYF